jgi:hypothetical protein
MRSHRPENHQYMRPVVRPRPRPADATTGALLLW